MDGYRDFFWTPCGRKAHKLSSVHFNLPPGPAAEVVSWGAANVRDGQLAVNEAAGYARDPRPHISLLYGIHATRGDGVRRLLERERAFRVRLGRLEAFTNRLGDVLKVGVESDDLHRLHERLARELLAAPSGYAYSPHVTVAFLRRGEAARLVGRGPFDGRTVLIDRFVFSSRGGTTQEIRLRK